MRRFLALAALAFSLFLLSSCQKQEEKVVTYEYPFAERIVFGAFEQDGIEENGPEDIVWCLMKKQGNKGLLVSEYTLDTVVAYPELSAISFHESQVAAWLNDFYQQAFTAAEKKSIFAAPMSDPVFLPDSDCFQTKSKHYFDCTPSRYARKNGVYSFQSSQNGLCCWWFVQNESSRSEQLSCVIDSLRVGTVPVNTEGVGIRPAIWVDLEKLEQNYSLAIEGYNQDIIYFLGDSPNLGKATVLRYLTDETQEPVESGFSVSPKKFTEVGKNYIIVEYNGKKAAIETYVYPKPVSCEVVSPPDNLYYAVGAEVNTRGLTLKYTLSEGNELLVDKGFSYEPKVISSERDRMLRVTAGGQIFSFDLDISPAILDLSIECKKDAFDFGGKFDPNDFSVMATFGDNISESIQEAIVWGASGDAVYTDSTLTLSYRGILKQIPIKLIRDIEAITFDKENQTFSYGEPVPESLCATILYKTGYTEEIPLSSIIGPKIWGPSMRGDYSYIAEESGDSSEKFETTVPYKLEFSMKSLSNIYVFILKEYSVGQSFSPYDCGVTFWYSETESKSFEAEQIPPVFWDNVTYQVVSSSTSRPVSGKFTEKGFHSATFRLGNIRSTMDFWVAPAKGKYELVTGTYSWTQAKNMAIMRGGHLATITSPQEQEAVYKAANGVRVWLGGYFGEDEKWHWVTDEPWQYTNWADGEPNGGWAEPYLALWPYQWNDLTDMSEEQEGFIIEYD